MTRTFDESQVHRWPAHAPDSRGGQFAPAPGTAGWVATASAVIDADLKARKRGYEPGQWVRGPDFDTRVARRAEQIYRRERQSKAVREAYTDEGLRELSVKMAEREVEAEAAVGVYVNGPHEIRISTSRRIDHTALMSIVDRLITTNPPFGDVRLGATITVKPQDQMDGSYGQVPRGSALVWISDETFEPYAAHGFRYGKMPAAMATSTLDYVVAHEWGHVLEGTRPDLIDEAEEVSTILNKLGVFHRVSGSADHLLDMHRLLEAAQMHGDMSGYGETNIHEAYAEAFAEWFITKGATTNKLVQAYARRFGWVAPT